MFIVNQYKNLISGIACSLLFTSVISCSYTQSGVVQTNSPLMQTETLKHAPVKLKVGEGFVNPIGYYETRPRFSWQIAPDSKVLRQSAYQIQVSQSQSFVSQDLLWDSHKVKSDDNAWIRYQGPKLKSRQRVYWRVRIWDEKERTSRWSDANYIELGLVDNDEWQADWIGHPYTGETDNDTILNKTVKGGRFPAPNNLYHRPQYLRTDFNLDSNIKQARLYITAKGVFKPYINGLEISQDLMTPGWTPYHKRIETLTYDVTKYLQPGENALAAILAEGWHSGRIFHPTKQNYIPPMRLIAQLEVKYHDGSVQTITSGEQWQSSIEGPIREASNYDGEVYDANFEQDNWNTPSFSINDLKDKGWRPVVVEPLDKEVELSPKRHQPVRVSNTLPAVEIVSHKDGVVIFDMGQNMVGVPEINIPVLANQPIKLRFAEALENRQMAVQNLRSAKNTDIIIPKKDGRLNYQPTFTFHGYRFVELSGFDSRQQPSLSWIKGKVMHSDFNVYNNFKSDHQLLNKLSSNVEWGLRGNFLDIPTDCPQRDERLGWTGDAQVFVGTSMYKADVYGFWAAWLQSVREDQGIDGLIPNYVPFRSFLVSHTGAAWGDAGTIIPWELYQFTGDINVLEENYSMMKRWLDYHIHHSYQFISTMSSHGDWLQPFPSDGSNGGDTHRDLIATAYFAHSADIVAKTANVLGYQDDAKQYKKLFQNIKNKFRDYFFDANLNLKSNIVKPPVFKNGSEKSGPRKTINPKVTQTSYLLPLAFNLFELNEQDAAAKHLVTLIEQSERHLRTGFLGTPLLASVLQKHGYSDLMYDILFKQSYPSWFYSINQGATTTWERWDSYHLEKGFNGEKMNSLNHYAYGAVAKWFYEGILGINADQVGFKKITIAPQFNAKLNQAEGSYQTPQGEIKVQWAITQNQLDMSVTVPKNTLANFVLPQIVDSTMMINGVKVRSETQLKNRMPGVYRLTGQVNY